MPRQALPFSCVSCVSLFKISQTALSILLVWFVVAGVAGADSFDRYAVIIQRQPFGEPPAAPPPPTPTGEAWAKHLRLHSFYDIGDGWRVGILDNRDKSNHILAIGDKTPDGIELIAAGYASEAKDADFVATLQKGDERCDLKPSGTFTMLSAAEQRRRDTRNRRRTKPSLRPRRQKEKEPRPEPLYKGKELDTHLQEYQKELIRRNVEGEKVPLLPIPLSPESDAELVREGYLPPVDQ